MAAAQAAGGFWKAAGDSIRRKAGSMMGGTLETAWTDLANHGNAHLTRAMGGALAGAGLGIGTHVATGLMGLAGSPFGLTSNEMSFGGAMSAGFRGALMGGIMGAGAVGKVSTRPGQYAIDSIEQLAKGPNPWRSNLLDGIRRHASQGVYSSIEKGTRGQLVKDSHQFRGWAKGLMKTYGGLRSNEAIAKSADSLGSVGDMMMEGAVLAGNRPLGPRVANMAKHAWGNMRSGDMGGIVRTLGTGAAMGGLASNIYNANALGMAVPSNYGYR